MARKKHKKVALTAKTADKHDLYQRSVQDPPQDIKFINRIYKKEHGHHPVVLREDFCGTALMCSDWVRGKSDRKAMGLDLDEPTLAWGRKHNVVPLNGDAKRVALLQANVLDAQDLKADVTAAFNFSYCIFKTRPDLLHYFKTSHSGLNTGGVFLLDIHGGLETTENIEEETKLDGFTYVWDQDPFDAVNGYGIRHIHFRFQDGSEMRRAFTYDWRIWSLPEVRDVLLEAGFSRVDIYWEGADGEGEGNGIFRKVKKAEEEQSWIAYVAAWR